MLKQVITQPIRTPGAVQRFCVLIAVDEDIDAGNLSVRQVSEVLSFCSKLHRASWAIANIYIVLH